MLAQNFKLISIFLSLLLVGCENSKIEFLIPSNYTGSIIVIYNQKSGSIEKETEHGIRIYQIPKNGVLFTQSQRIKGALNISFWYVDEDGHKLHEVFSEERIIHSKEEKDIFVSKIIDGQFSLTPDTNIDKTYYDDTFAHKVKFIYFHIGSQEDVNRGLAEANQRLVEISKSMTAN